MMEMNNRPLYRTHWGIPSQPRHNYKAPSKKVVSIPVHFVGSDSDSLEHKRSNSAIKIQKVVRGFLVRNTLRRIKAIRVEVEQIETKISASETKELMKRDQKERVRVSETIMNLLLRLDSIRVLNYYSGVRDCRKSVIKKAIALQEMVDQMVVGPTNQDQLQLTQVEAEDAGANEDGSVGDSEGKKIEGLGNEEEEEERDGEGEGVGEEMVDQIVGPTDQDVSSQKEEQHQGDADGEGYGSDGASEGMKMEGLENEEEEKMEVEEKQNEDGEGEGEGVSPTKGEEAHHEGEDADVEDSAGSVDASSDMFVADFEGKKMEGLRDEEEKMEVEEEQKEDGEESVGTSLVEEVEENCLVKEKEEGCEENEDCKGRRGEERDHEDNNSRELLKKMMEDNERMMRMMAQLFERNEMQTRLLSSLSHRVEQLERAFACEKLRRKKRRNVDAKHKETESKNGCI